MFKLIKNLFNKKSTNKSVEEADSSNLKSFTIDRADYLFEHALELYCQSHQTSVESLSEEELALVEKRAGYHIANFLVWLAKHDLLGSETSGYDYEGAQLLKEEKISGSDYLFDYCDGKLWSIDVSDKLYPFIKDFYQDYLDFCTTVLVDKMAQTDFTWSNYHLLEEDIDEIFASYKEQLV